MRYKFFLDFEKEEQWLNQMAREGWELTGKSAGYAFGKVDPNDTIIRIDYRSFKTNDAFEEYLTLFRDSGWKHIAGTRNSGAQYFKKVDNDGVDDIFSDTPSKAGRYKRLSEMWLTLAASYVPIFVALYTTKIVSIDKVLNPKLLYYTPGLWEKTGISFWRAFIFETPFVVMRGFSWIIFLAMLVLFFIFGMKAERNYQRASH